MLVRFDIALKEIGKSVEIRHKREQPSLWHTGNFCRSASLRAHCGGSELRGGLRI